MHTGLIPASTHKNEVLDVDGVIRANGELMFLVLKKANLYRAAFGTTADLAWVATVHRPACQAGEHANKYQAVRR